MLLLLLFEAAGGGVLDGAELKLRKEWFTRVGCWYTAFAPDCGGVVAAASVAIARVLPGD